MASLAHLSDLHLGASRAARRMARALVEAVRERGIEHTVVTGDVTNLGLRSEYETFLEVFEPLLSQGRLTVVPGNHDRCGGDVASLLQDGPRVQVRRFPGLYLVKVDSTAPHNRLMWRAHGDLCDATLASIEAALEAAPGDALVTVLLHHHVVPLPTESWHEALAHRAGYPWTEELELGEELLRRALGRCDLVLHGHRHIPRAFVVAPESARPLRIYNAGSSTAHGAFRVFHHGHGALLGEPRWELAVPQRRPAASFGAGAAELQLA